MGKGSKQRPTDQSKFNVNYDNIFKKPAPPKKKEVTKPKGDKL